MSVRTCRPCRQIKQGLIATIEFSLFGFHILDQKFVIFSVRQNEKCATCPSDTNFHNDDEFRNQYSASLD